MKNIYSTGQLLKDLRSDLTELPRSILEKDKSAKSYLEVLLLYPGVKAILFHRLAHWLFYKNQSFLARAFSELSRWITNIEIHPGAHLGQNVFIDHGFGTVIGETSSVGAGCMIFHGVTLRSINSRSEGERHPAVG